MQIDFKKVAYMCMVALFIPWFWEVLIFESVVVVVL